MFYALATVEGGSSAVPRVRYVVHRNFLGNTDCLLTTTDMRSEKGKQMGVAQRVPVELAWYISAERTQFRIRGQAFLVAAPDATAKDVVAPPTEGFWPESQNWSAERVHMWQSLSPAMQRSFLGPPPGLPMSSADSESNLENTTEPRGDNVSPNFALLVIEPSEVDQLDLSSFRRTIYTRKSTSVWTQGEVVP